jgi:hypothetical protein
MTLRQSEPCTALLCYLFQGIVTPGSVETLSFDETAPEVYPDHPKADNSFATKPDKSICS